MLASAWLSKVVKHDNMMKLLPCKDIEGEMVLIKNVFVIIYWWQLQEHHIEGMHLNSQQVNQSPKTELDCRVWPDRERLFCLFHCIHFGLELALDFRVADNTKPLIFQQQPLLICSTQVRHAEF